jgi:hypothetical protein
MQRHFSPFVFLLVLSACGQLNHAGGDDEYGDPVDQTPDDFNVAEWVDAHIRLLGIDPYVGDQPNVLNGPIVDEELAATPPAEREYVAFTPSTPPQPDHQTGKCIYCGWPSKPHMKGIGEVPYWQWTATHDFPANIAYERSKSDFGHQQGDLRSGLIGVFGMYAPSVAFGSLVPLFCPDEYPRPPICTSLWLQIGHPYIGGRYNVYGLPCSMAIDESLLADGEDPLGGSQSQDCFDHVEGVGVNPAAPNVPPAADMITPEICLANGQTYRPEIAALTSFGRNGFTILNLREAKWLINTVGDLTEPAEELLEALPWWDYGQEQWDYFHYEDATWRWSETSVTGECSFGAALTMLGGPTETIDECVLHQSAACPATHKAVFPPFNAFEMLTECTQAMGDYVAQVPGFCALPYFDWVANEAALMPDGSIDPIVQFDLANNGYHRGFNLRLDAMPDELIEEWSQSVLFVPTDDGVRLDLPRVAAGDQVAAARYATGLALLAEFGLKPGDRIVSIDHDIDLRDTSATPMDALLLVLDRWSTAQEDGQPTMTSLWIERDDGWVLPTYLFPVYRPLPPDPTVADDGTDDTTSG